MEEFDSHRSISSHRVTGWSGPSGTFTIGLRPLNRFERIKLALLLVAGGVVTLALLFAAFMIGLILVIPLVILGTIWAFWISWRMRRRSRSGLY